MSLPILVKYMNPWKYRRSLAAERVDALRHRDGDNCTRCKRPMRFDLQDGHDLMPRIEALLSGATAGQGGIDNLCLTHIRCNAQAGDNTAEVRERARIKNEAALFAKSKQKRRRRA